MVPLAPIAVGAVFRRIGSEIFVSRTIAKATALLEPLQLGLGTPHAAEAIHGFNRQVRDNVSN